MTYEDWLREWQGWIRWELLCRAEDEDDPGLNDAIRRIDERLAHADEG